MEVARIVVTSLVGAFLISRVQLSPITSWVLLAIYVLI
jgi:hypothetical protein